MKTVAVVGAKGKMGSLVCEVLKADYKVVKLDIGDTLDKAGKLDLVIDFASHESSVVSAEYCEKNKVRLIVGSTGQTDEELITIFKAARVVPVLKAGNFSVGIHLLKKALVSILKETGGEVTILEKHHSEKADRPSGTALELAYLAEETSGKTPEVLSVRGGKEIGTHSALIYFGDEVIELKHQAFSRKAFADGAMLAVDYLMKQTEAKLYLFEDIFQTQNAFCDSN